MIPEHRQTRRFLPSVVVVRFEHPTNGEQTSAFVWDMTVSGLFLETDAVVETASLLALSLKLRDGEMPIDARVAWTRAEPEGDDAPRGMAISFIDLPDDVAFAIRGILHESIPGKPADVAEPIAAKKAERVGRKTVIGVAPPANVPDKPEVAEAPAAVIASGPKESVVNADAETVALAAPTAEPEEERAPVPIPKGRRARVLAVLGIAAAAVVLFVVGFRALSRPEQAVLPAESATTITSATPAPTPVASEAPPKPSAHPVSKPHAAPHHAGASTAHPHTAPSTKPHPPRPTKR
jgi:hypothetical protein